MLIFYELSVPARLLRGPPLRHQQIQVIVACGHLSGIGSSASHTLALAYMLPRHF